MEIIVAITTTEVRPTSYLVMSFIEAITVTFLLASRTNLPSQTGTAVRYAPELTREPSEAPNNRNAFFGRAYPTKSAAISRVFKSHRTERLPTKWLGGGKTDPLTNNAM
jgi:hypothetical protein